MTPSILARIGLVTYRDLPALAPDEKLLAEALTRRGFSAEPVVWDDKRVDWAAYLVCVIRSTWDYHYRRDEFVEWCRKAGETTAIWNPPGIVHWNSHKTYLRDLERAGVPVIPTVWVEPEEQVKILEVMEAHGWPEVVIKPAVSASAYLTARFTPSAAAQAQEHLERGLRHGTMMVQPYLTSVEAAGERSLIYFNGRFSHAVRREPSLVAVPEAGGAYLIDASPEDIDLAEQSLATCGQPTLYARIDMTADNHGKMRLMELELVEPSLFLGAARESAERFAQAIAARCTGA